MSDAYFRRVFIHLEKRKVRGAHFALQLCSKIHGIVSNYCRD